MEKLDIIDRSGKATAQVDLPENVFSQAANDHLIYEAVVNYRANQRQGTRRPGGSRAGGRAAHVLDVRHRPAA